MSAPTTWRHWLRDPHAAAYLRDHPECWEDAIPHMAAFITHILRRAGVASQFDDPLFDREEWRHLAVMFTWQALRTYDETRTMPLTYLYAYVTGWLRRELRDRTFAAGIRIPRGQPRTVGVTSWEHMVAVTDEGSPVTLANLLAAPDPFPDVEFLVDVTGVLSRLSPQHRLIILGYLTGMTQRELGTWAGMSQVQISRILRRFAKDVAPEREHRTHIRQRAKLAKSTGRVSP